MFTSTHRAISLTSIIAKVFEKQLADLLIIHIETEYHQKGTKCIQKKFFLHFDNNTLKKSIQLCSPYLLTNRLDKYEI